jgi:pyruvate dehydrogenase E2 component (dihydrolipoyllysine-residue acetyltransferase)
MGEFRMPSLGADMTEGTLVEWLVKPGDRVKRGDIIATVETQKGLFEVENYENGLVQEMLVPPGSTVPVGTVLAKLTSEGKAIPASKGLPDAAEVQPAPQTSKTAMKQAPESPRLPPASPSERVPISPSARKLAAELKVDLGGIRGTGPHGAIQRADVERAAQEKHAAVGAPVPPRTEFPPAVDYQAGMRRAIAAAMSRANREIPHYYLETDIDMGGALRWLEKENMKRTIKDRILPAVLLLKAVAKALVDVPELNGFWLDGRHQVRESIHVGFAISLRQGGLITPAIHNVDLLSLDELMAATRDLITRTRNGRLRSSEMTDATITVTNLGDLGVNTVYGVIYPPQVALVAFGRISERPWAEQGMLGVRRVVTATLAADHRATDGHRGSLFLEALDRHLQVPENL